MSVAKGWTGSALGPAVPSFTPGRVQQLTPGAWKVLNDPIPPRVIVTPDHHELAIRTLMQLIAQADSIIADPAELAARAWAIADAMVVEFRKRV